MEERVAELEIRLAFQDNTIQELNNELIQQQQQLTKLIQDMNGLKHQVNLLLPSLVASESQETPPPHY